MEIKQIQLQAKSQTDKNRKVAYAITIVVMLFTFLLGLTAEYIQLLSLMPMLWALIYPYFVENAFLRLSRGETFDSETFFVAEFGDHWKHYVKTSFFVNLSVTLWTFVFIIPGFIKQIAYSMTPFVLYDNPNLTTRQIMDESERIMKGNAGTFIKLYLSYFILPILLNALLIVSGVYAFFLAWAGTNPGLVMILLGLFILSLTFNVLLTILITPRWHFAKVALYEEIKNKERA